MTQDEVHFERPAPPAGKRPPDPPGSLERLMWRPQRMVQWFDPVQLGNTAVRALLSSIFGAYADKREVQAALSRDAQPAVHDYSRRTELWIDYVSDVGDGFDSTYTLAWLLGQRRLPGADPSARGEERRGAERLAATPRGDVLVLGGDQVYPTASRREYENRFAGPYEAALPWAPEGEQPDLFAVPGNHDWYDGLTAFMRQFCQQRGIGAWETRQTRSYFALRLPQRWWLLGIDIQLGSDIDKPQLDYFKKVAERMDEGDRVILCTGQPAWVHVKESPRAYENIAFFERVVLCPCKAQLSLTLTGDLHHYARYSDTTGERHKITAGGGGAYFYGTHLLPSSVELPKADPQEPGQGATPRTKRFERRKVYPEPRVSQALRGGAAFLGAQNPRFIVFLGALYTLFTWFLQEAGRVHLQTGDLMRWLSTMPPGDAGRVLLTTMQITLRAPLMLALAAFFVWALYTFCTPDPGRPKWLKWFGAVHGAAHLVMVLLLTWLFAWLNHSVLAIGSPELRGVAFLVEMVVVGGTLGSLLFGLALLPGVNFNEAYSSQHIEHYKNFLRLHVAENGTLTVYPVGIDRVERWRIDSDAKPGEPYFRPREGEPPRVRLIEEPIVLAAPAPSLVKVRAHAVVNAATTPEER